MSLWDKLVGATKTRSPSVLKNPVTDTTKPNKRMHVTVNKLTHGLNLTLPPPPAHKLGEQGFAIFSDESGSIAKACKQLSIKLPNSFVFRVWNNDPDSDSFIPSQEPGRYISIRGNASVINRLKDNELKGDSFLVHSSDNIDAVDKV